LLPLSQKILFSPEFDVEKYESALSRAPVVSNAIFLGISGFTTNLHPNLPPLFLLIDEISADVVENIDKKIIRSDLLKVLRTFVEIRSAYLPLKQGVLDLIEDGIEEITRLLKFFQ
jgi:hypothetical protein